MRKIIFFLMFVFLLNFISADSQLSMQCGGDSELIIGCFGDGQYSYIGGSITPPTITDTTNPLIEFVNPTFPNATTTSNTNIPINVSITEDNLNDITFNWNGTNYTVFDNNVVLMMNFDNVSGIGESYNNSNGTIIVDVSNFSNNGTLYGTPISENYVSGKYGNAYNFDGVDDYILINDNSSLDQKEHLSISFWVKGVNTSGIIISKSKGDFGSINDDITWRVKHTGSNIYIEVASDTSNGIRYSSTNIINSSKWYYITAVYNGTGQTLDMYVDGILDNGGLTIGGGRGATMPTSLRQNNLKVSIGAENSVLTADLISFFNGTIDEVMIWNKSLTASDVQQLYFTNIKKYDSNKWSLYVNQKKNSTDGLDDGTYTYQAFANDEEGNSNSTEKRYVTITEDNTSPTITLVTPEQGSQDFDGVVKFTYIPSDANTINNCSLIYNTGYGTKVYTTDTSISNGTSNIIEVVGISDNHPLYSNDLKWSINCTDSFNNIGSSEIRSLDTKEGIISSGGGTGGGTPEKEKEDSINISELDPKYINILYSKKWRAGKDEIIEIEAFNHNNMKYLPKNITFNFNISGIRFIAQGIRDNKTIAKFSVDDNVDLGEYQIEIIVFDERSISQNITFMIDENSRIFGISAETERTSEMIKKIIMAIAGMSIFFLLIILVFYDKLKKKLKTRNI